MKEVDAEKVKSAGYRIGQLFACTVAICLTLVMVAVTIKVIGYILF